MRRLIALPIVLAMFIAPLQSLSNTAYACSCAPREPEELVAGADLIVIGELARFDNRTVALEDNRTAVLAVERYLKGSGGSELLIDEPATPDSCAYFFDEDTGGRRHLVLLYEDGNEYRTNLCSGNAPADSPGYDSYLAQITSITGPGQPPDGSPPQEDEDEHTEDTPWAVILPIAFAIPLAVLLIPALLRRRGGGH